MSRPAIRIAIIGVAIGLAVMIVTVSVVLGFKHTIRDKVIGFGSHIQVHHVLTYSGSDPHPICLDDTLMAKLQSIQGVRHVERYTMAQGILKTDNDFLGAMFKGIGPEYDTSFLKEHLLTGEMPQFSDTTSYYQLLISKMIADKLQLKTGDKVFAYFIDEDGVKTRRYTVNGIYQTNLTRFDEAICFTDIYTANKINGWNQDQFTGAEISVENIAQLQQTADRFVEQINRTEDRQGNVLTSETIYELYPQVFSWLELLDLNVWIILALMLAVAGFTMISGLLIIILERTQMIGILKALGAGNGSIISTFMYYGIMITGRGMLWGNVLGIGLVLLQQYTGIITLDAQTYYVSEAPMELNPLLILLINLQTIMSCAVVLLLPCILILFIHPARSMHYE